MRRHCHSPLFRVLCGLLCLSPFAVAHAQSELAAFAASSGMVSPSAATGSTTTLPKAQNWMSSDVSAAWSSGFSGKGTTITFVDDFNSSSKFSGNINGTVQTQTHGNWTSEQAGLIAYSANIIKTDFNASGNTPVTLARGLNIINASFGMYASSAYANYNFTYNNQVNSMVSYANSTNAVTSALIVKAAGNDAIPIGYLTAGKFMPGINASGNFDALNKSLRGAPNVIYAGALSTNGSSTAPAVMASYSNTAGTDPTIQKQFLVVGVNSSQMGIAGTSFAAPIISAYGSIIGSKFTTASPTQITNQLLSTARTDTLNNYSAAVYGRGEASLSRALAPVSIK